MLRSGGFLVNREIFALEVSESPAPRRALPNTKPSVFNSDLKLVI